MTKTVINTNPIPERGIQVCTLDRNDILNRDGSLAFFKIVDARTTQLRGKIFHLVRVDCKTYVAPMGGGVPKLASQYNESTLCQPISVTITETERFDHRCDEEF
jgi:hypothetical protein